MRVIEFYLLLDMLLMDTRPISMEMKLLDMKLAYGFILGQEVKLPEHMVMKSDLG